VWLARLTGANFIGFSLPGSILSGGAQNPRTDDGEKKSGATMTYAGGLLNSA